MRIYLDHNATTPVEPTVAEAVGDALLTCFGNASSVHAFGQTAKAALDEARARVATLVGGEPSEIVFTSGGTESDNLAIRGAMEAAPDGRRHVIASAIEHEAVLNTLKALAAHGCTTTQLPVDASGVVDPASLRDALTPETALVSVMHVNNEIGTIQPIAELARLTHEQGALFHTDAVQSGGKLPLDVGALGVDLLSLSAHKFNGPKGVGVLWVRRGSRVVAAMTGGRQERNRRAGTENVPAIVGLGVAARIAVAQLDSEGARIGALRDRLETGVLARVPRTAVNGAPESTSADDVQHQLRWHRSRGVAHRPRPRGRGRLDRLGLLLRSTRTVPRPESHGLGPPSRAELHPLQSGARQHPGRDRSRARRPSPGRHEAADAGSVGRPRARVVDSRDVSTVLAPCA